MAVSVVQILRAVSGGQAHFRSLFDLELLCEEGSATPFYNVGNSAVLFRAVVGGALCSIKCYTSQSAHRRAIYGDRLFREELYVPLERERGEWIDIVVERWIEGVTLSERIKELVEADDQKGIARLSKAFDRLAFDGLRSTSAHGDITCENIIVDSSDGLHLIDFDAAFVPSLAGAKSIELGTEAYQHPRRSCSDFDRSIDDYSIALISSALSALALDLSLYGRFSFGEGLLFDPLDIAKGRSEALAVVLDLFSRSGAPASYVVAKMLNSLYPNLPELEAIMRCKVEGVGTQTPPVTIFCRDGRWGFCDQSGVEAIPPLFDNALGFREGFAAVKLGDFWHYINQQAEVVINCSGYQKIKSFKDGVGRGVPLGSAEWVEIPYLQ